MKKRIRLVLATVIICMAAVLSLLIPIVYHAYAAKPVKADCILVPGCQIWGRTPSWMLEYRLEKALSLYKQGYAGTIIVSGGQGADEITTEASVMKQWLADRGVDSTHILEESRSTSTFENLAFSLAIMKEHSLQSTIVVTSDFHIFRSLMLAERLGIKATGAPAASVPHLKPYYYVREVVSVVKSHLFDHTVTLPVEDRKPEVLRSSRVEYASTPKPDNKHLREVNPDIPLKEIIQSKGLERKRDFSLVVELATRTLLFKHGTETLKEYSIAAGYHTDQGNKEKEGDGRTPLGQFYICSKKVYSPPKGYIGSRWMLLSYPGLEAAEEGFQEGRIDRDTLQQIRKAIERKRVPPQDTILGSAIGIHGGGRPQLARDWTAGCIGMYDQDVEEIFDYVWVGTPVLIR